MADPPDQRGLLTFAHLCQSSATNTDSAWCGAAAKMQAMSLCATGSGAPINPRSGSFRSGRDPLRGAPGSLLSSVRHDLP